MTTLIYWQTNSTIGKTATTTIGDRGPSQPCNAPAQEFRNITHHRPISHFILIKYMYFNVLYITRVARGYNSLDSWTSANGSNGTYSKREPQNADQSSNSADLCFRLLRQLILLVAEQLHRYMATNTQNGYIFFFDRCNSLREMNRRLLALSVNIRDVRILALKLNKNYYDLDPQSNKN